VILRFSAASCCTLLAMAASSEAPLEERMTSAGAAITAVPISAANAVTAKGNAPTRLNATPRNVKPHLLRGRRRRSPAPAHYAVQW
jgi:hypothetical protein